MFVIGKQFKLSLMFAGKARSLPIWWTTTEPNVNNRNLCMFVFLLGRPFQLSLMFVGKAQELTLEWAPERCFTRIGCGLSHKHYKMQKS